MENAQVARAFDELAELLELSGENPFKTRAYRVFANAVRALEEPIATVARRGGLEEMPGVGTAIAGKVDELLLTGTCRALEKARAAIPTTLPTLLHVPGLGPKAVRRLWQEVGVTTLGELLRACEDGRLATLAGFGPKKQTKILAAVHEIAEGGGGLLLGTARAATEAVRARLDAAAADVVLVGDGRRGVAVVHEARVLVRGFAATAVARALEKPGDPSFTEITRDGSEVSATIPPTIDVRVRAVPTKHWVYALVRETGNREHVRWLEERAAALGGLPIVCAEADSEEAVYAALGVTYVPPELREAAAPEVPRALVETTAVRGVFHVHTDWSDGTATIAAMARAARDAGLAYVGISDHSRAASYAHGLDASRLDDQKRAIDAARSEVPGVRILHGIEVDVLADGTLDLDDDTLASLDFVIASVHTHLSMGPREMTRRVARAVAHPLVTILGHPTGRLLLARRGFTFDLAEVAKAAAANDTYLEINANPQRLDLDDEMIRRAASFGAKFAINPDAHATRGFDDTSLGVAVARRAALGPELILNACGEAEIVATLAARKTRALERMGRV